MKTIKHLIKIIVILCVAIVLASCSKNVSISDSDSNFANDENLGFIQKLNIDSTDYPIGISGNYFYYMCETNSADDFCDYNIMRYDLVTQKNANIGKINNLTTWSGTYAFVNCNKFFSVFGTTKEDGSVNQHIMIDSQKGNISVFKNDNYFPPLIQSVSVNEDCFLEFQPQQLENGTYKYIVRLGNPNGETRDIIVKEQGASRKGETIVDVCVYANTIYSFEYEEQKAYICSYDLEGKLIAKESVEFVNDFLSTPNDETGDTEIMWSMDVVNGYYFFKTLNGSRLTLFKSENGWKKRDDLFMDQAGTSNDLVVNVNPLDEKYKKVILYNYNTQKLFCIDTDSGKSENLDLNLKNVAYCMTDGKQLVFQNDKQEFYYIADVFAK